MTKTFILPVPFCRGSKALPTRAPKHLLLSTHFIACPGVLEVVNKSPIWIAPFSAETFVGTLPANANKFPSVSFPKLTPGSVEMIPATEVSNALLDLITCSGFFRSIATTSPACNLDYSSLLFWLYDGFLVFVQD